MIFSISYILSQIFIILNYVFLVITYQLKDHKKILLFNIASLTSAGLSYIFLSAYTGLAMVIISIIRNIIFIIYKNRTNQKSITPKDLYILIGIYIVIIILATLTYDGLWSLMSVLATIIYTYSVWQKNTKIYKWLGIPVSLCWITYNIYIASLFGIILEGILMTSAIIGLIRETKGSEKC